MNDQAPQDQTPNDQTPDDKAVAEPGKSEKPASEAKPRESGREPVGTAETPEAVEIQQRCVDILQQIFDPEIPVDIYELGLIYEINVEPEAGKVDIKMTLTSPACPVAGTLPGEVETRVSEAEGVKEVDVELVWDPPWTMELLSEAAKLQMGLT